MLCSLKFCKENGGNYIRDYGLFISFVILGIVIWLFKLNQSLFYFINSLHVIFPTMVWEGLNFVSYSKTLILPILLLIITFAFRRDKLINVIILVLAYFLVFNGLKALFGEARPYIVLPSDSFFWVNPFADATKFAYKSFPSGHTGNMAVFVFTLSNLFHKRWLSISLFVLLILTGLARICTGWHWPLDVVSSGLISYVLVKICLNIYKK